jgi:ORF6N domain
MPKTLTNGQRRQSVPLEVAARRVYIFRGKRIMLDADVAALYRVPTFRLNEAVKRNRDRFPGDFMFQLTAEEAAALTSDSAMSNIGRGGRYRLPLAFTELGVAMVSSVLKSERAVQMNLASVRALLYSNFRVSFHREADLQRISYAHTGSLRHRSPRDD